MSARLCVIAACLLAALNPLAAGDMDLPETRRKAYVVEVGSARVPLEQILEVWGPSWHETVLSVQRGKLPAGECDAKLLAEWKAAIETVVREEIFYQEAEREFDMMIVKQARQIFEQQTGRRSSPGSMATEERIRRDLRQHFEKSVQRQLTDFVDRHIRAAGGLEQLKRVIAGRGITWTEWRERLKKKAFADQYLRTTLGPRVQSHPRPADIREYYRDHPDEFRTAGAVVFRHILFSFDKRGGEEAARSAAGSVYDAIAEGRMTFEEAARRFSDDEASKTRGGLEETVSTDPDREAWLHDVREAVRGEEPGAIGPILLSAAGAHLVMPISEQPGAAISFREAQGAIKKKLHAAQWETELEKLYEELRDKVRVKILMPEFPAQYRWAAVANRRHARPSRRIGPGPVPESDASQNKPQE